MKKTIDYYIRIQRVMQYIDEHLDEHITLKELSKIACFSQYHFHRVFVACLGLTIQEYIYFKRLAKAASLLLNSTLPVTDIALLVGYGTHAAFSKSFRKCYDMTPSEYRKMRGKGVNIHVPGIMNPVGSQKKLSRENRSEKISHVVREIPEMKVMCITKKGFGGGFFEAATDAFNEVNLYVIRNKLVDRIGHYLSIIPDLPYGYHDPDAKIHCGFSLKGDLLCDDHLDALTIEKGRYAVFTHHGPYEYIFQTWNTAYFTCAFAGEERLRDTAPFEIYLNSPIDTPAQKLITEIHIPIM